MAGLCAAARARELGADVLVLEKGDRAGGSMRLSSGFVWRHDELRPTSAPNVPTATRRSSALILERFDDGIGWLESLGAPVADSRDRQPADVRRAVRHGAA